MTWGSSSRSGHHPGAMGRGAWKAQGDSWGTLEFRVQEKPKRAPKREGMIPLGKK